MPPETAVLDYRSPQTQSVAGRPRRLLSHCRTAAFLCLVTIAFDWKVMDIRGDLQQIPELEWVLPIYGVTAAVLAVAVGRLARADRVWLWLCGAIYLLTLAWAVLVPRLNH
jgi:hypothetical protein